ncbi:hypothetical protein HZA96_03255 [Candidatus Woesearchaeota archaeon]|nr:hypothetical protein [Candidatus Woesearchaeota archaeon]
MDICIKNVDDGNWKEILYGKKKLKGLLSREEMSRIHQDFKKNFKMRGSDCGIHY